MKTELRLKEKLDNIISEYDITLVGKGYYQCICPYNNIENFLDEIVKLNIKVEGFSFWCFVPDDGSHKPCGHGGPKTKNGYYSEIDMYMSYEFESVDLMKRYLLHDYKKSDDYKSCYNPSFHLDISNQAFIE